LGPRETVEESRVETELQLRPQSPPGKSLAGFASYLELQEELSAMNSSLVYLLAFCIGLVTGLRSMTGPALVCWAAHLGWLDLEGSRLAFMESTVATYAFSAMALGELIADKLPFVPNRTSTGPLFGRVVLGALSGAALCVATGHSSAVGAMLGGVSGAMGAFAGYQARAGLVKTSRCRIG
jgi:uncharacterized membrane protein